ncbi:MAG TPA: DMT family transporter [Gemmatimonadaceae bacterium]|nr:DMT family transporter [Gemmatimonadaceae bacterium]
MASTLDVTAARPSQAAPSGLTVTDLLLLCMAVIWGVNYAVVKFGAAQVDPLVFNSVRVVLATVVLVAIVVVTAQPWPRGRELWALLGLGVLGNGLYQYLFIEGIARTRAGDAALILAAAPAFMAIIGRMRGTERTGALGVAGILLSLSGITLVVFGDSGGAAHAASVTGDLLLLVGCLCWSLYTVFLRPYTERVDGITLSAVTMIGGAVPLVLVSLPTLSRVNLGSVGIGGWAAVAYSGLLALVVAYLFWYRGVKTLGPTRSAMYANLQPIIALAVAWATLHETPRLLQLIGAACILGGLLLTRLQVAPVNPPCE